MWINDDEVINHHCDVSRILDDILDSVVQEDFNRRQDETIKDEPTIVAIKAADPAKKKRWVDSRAKAFEASKRTRWNDNKDIRSYFVSTKK